MYRFSNVFANPQGSPIRALFKYLSEPGMISFAGGYPNPDLFDTDGLKEASERAFVNSRSCLQYGNTDGTPQFKSEIIRLMHDRGIETKPENIVVTTGSQQGFDLTLRVLINAGDRILIEQPTYSSNIQAARTYQTRIDPIPVLEDGLDIDVLEKVLKDASEKGDRPKLLYTIPTFGNPSGVTMPVEHRLRLLELAVRYQLIIVEDAPYSDLRFSGPPVPSLAALAQQIPNASDWVIHLASLSKIVAPGMRMGWIIAPSEIASRCSVAKQSADVGCSPWMQGIAAEYLAGGRLEGHIKKIQAAYGEKCRAMAAGLRAELGDAVSFNEPNGGMFIWARLNDGFKATDLLEESIPRKVMFVPGAGFQISDPDLSAFRLSFAMPNLEEVKEGVIRLGDAMKSLRSKKK